MPDDHPGADCPLRALDKRNAGQALHRALATRRFGHAKSVLDSTLHGVVAELLADALVKAGYVVAISAPRTRRTRARCGRQTRT